MIQPLSGCLNIMILKYDENKLVHYDMQVVRSLCLLGANQVVDPHKSSLCSNFDTYALHQNMQLSYPRSFLKHFSLLLQYQVTRFFYCGHHRVSKQSYMFLSQGSLQRQPSWA